MGDLNDGSFNTDMKLRFANPMYTASATVEIAGPNFIAAEAATQIPGSMRDILKSHKISCDLEKNAFECAIMIKAALAAEI